MKQSSILHNTASEVWRDSSLQGLVFYSGIAMILPAGGKKSIFFLNNRVEQSKREKRGTFASYFSHLVAFNLAMKLITPPLRPQRETVRRGLKKREESLTTVKYAGFQKIFKYNSITIYDIVAR